MITQIHQYLYVCNLQILFVIKHIIFVFYHFLYEENTLEV